MLIRLLIGTIHSDKQGLGPVIPSARISQIEPLEIV